MSPPSDLISTSLNFSWLYWLEKVPLMELNLMMA